jgi:hypothetical protein
MLSTRDLYPSRDRATNVQLIKNLRAATNQEAFEAADKEIAMALHPSLLAELDWMEMTMPAHQRTAGASFVDGLFVHHLAAIMSQRKVDFDLSEEELRWEISANINFYKNLVSDEQRPLDVLGEQLSKRIQDCLESLEPDMAGAIARICDAERHRINSEFAGVQDPDWIMLMIDVEIKNALAISLDHVSSRMQTKQFMRAVGGQFPRIEVPSIESEDDLQLLLKKLKDLEDYARKFSVCRLAAICLVLRELFAGTDVSAFKGFGGEIAVGYGHCGNCSMMYASRAIVSYDPTCPGLFRGKDGQINFSTNFNVSVCPFCGDQQRAETPSMFYLPQRNQVIYNFPRLGQFSEDKAREVHRPVLSAIRERYLARISADEVVKFEAANEEVTYSAAEFLIAIQMGTTVKEEHVYNVVRLINGSGLIMDPTKGVIIELTPAEMRDHWRSAGPMTTNTAAKEEDARGGPLMKDAMDAFDARDYERSRDILEKLHQTHPDDQVVRKNLAVVYVALGDKESARRVVGG